MQHMNSVRVPATIIFSALLVIIMVSSSRTTYTLSQPREVTSLASCSNTPAVVREADIRNACPLQRPWPRRTHWPHNSVVDFAAPAPLQRSETGGGMVRAQQDD